jgi:dCMP deaminase
MKTASLEELEFCLEQAAKVAADESADPRTKNGAVVAQSHAGVGRCRRYILGANRYFTDRWSARVTDRGTKLTYIEHAEREAIYRAAREGLSLAGATMYALWAACPECARAIVGAGITRLVTLKKTRELTPERWLEPLRVADQMLADAGVAVEFYAESLGVRIMFDGEEVEV